MTEKDFWQIVAYASEGGVLELPILEKRLEELSDESVSDFNDWMQDSISKLKTRRSLKALRKNPHILQPISDDGFEYLLAGVVASGQEAFEAVLNDADSLQLGQWHENEELLYVAEDIIESRDETDESDDFSQEVTPSSVPVFSARYPVESAQLELGFPVDSFGWIEVDVQDADKPPIEILSHAQGSFVIYPEFHLGFVREAFQNAATSALDALHPKIDFRKIPGLVIHMSVSIGGQQCGPDIQAMCSRLGPFDLYPGVAIGVDRQSLPTAASSTFQRYAESVIRRGLEKYFENQPRELEIISRYQFSG